jgi:uncharacterized protein YggE
MRQSVRILLFVSCCSLAFGQSDPNSVTVSASTNTNLQPDQAVFGVAIQSPIGTGLDDVVAALQGLGITAANLSGLNTPGQLDSPPTIQWVFSLSAPLSKTKDTVATLASLQQAIAKANNGLTLSFSIVGTQVSQQLAQSQTCSFPNLIADATAQAQKLAAGANLTVGRILAISSSGVTGVSSQGSVYAGLLQVYVPLNSAVPPPCALTVKFALTGY